MNDVTYSVEEQQAHLGKKGFETGNFEMLKDLVLGQVKKTIYRYNPNHFLPVEDIAWDCFTSLWMKGFFHKYDMTLSQKHTYLWNGVKNYLIDQERGASTRLKCYSLDVPISGKSEKTFGELVNESLEDAAVGIEAYLEIINLVRPEISGRFEKKRKRREADIEGVGSFVLSEYAVLYLTLSGYKNKEISDLFGVSSFYVSQLYKKGVEILQETVDARELDGDVSDCFQVIIENKLEECVCPHCRSKNTRFWSSDTTSGVPFYVCRDCTKAFSEFTGTPLHNLKNHERLKYVRLGELYCEGLTVGQLSVQLDIGVDKVRKWVDMYNDYFMGDTSILIKGKLNRWLRIINEAEKRK